MKRILLYFLLLSLPILIIGQGERNPKGISSNANAAPGFSTPPNFSMLTPFEHMCYDKFDPVYCFGAEPRYLDNVVPLPAVSEFPTVVGEAYKSCVSPFQVEVEMVANEGNYLESINSERSAWSHIDGPGSMGKIAFYLKGINPLIIRFIDEEGNFTQIEEELMESDFVPNGLQLPTGYEWKDYKNSIRWHPTELAIFYPKGNKLVKRRLNLTSQILEEAEDIVTFGAGPESDPDFVIGSLALKEISQSLYKIKFSHKIAGGDGNDVNAGRLLVSLVEGSLEDQIVTGPGQVNNTKFLVFDFNTNQIIKQSISWTGVQKYFENLSTPVASGPVSFSTSVINSHSFSFSNSGTNAFPLDDFDYAQVSASGLYIATRQRGQGFKLFDFSGNLINFNLTPFQTINAVPMTNHFESAYFLADENGAEKIRECIIGKANPSGAAVLNSLTNITPAFKEGDLFALYWYPDNNLSFPIPNGKLNIKVERILEWKDNSSGVYSGAQFSAVSDEQNAQTSIFYPYNISADYSYRMLVSMRSANPDNDENNNGTPLTWYPYYGEIIELSLYHGDLEPRRLIQHFVMDKFDYLGTKEQASFQPEAWFSPDGSRFLFKSSGVRTNYNTDPTHNEQNLYLVEVPLRSHINLRNCHGHSPLRESSVVKPSFQVYPNPVEQGYVLLRFEGSDRGPFPGKVRIIGIDGRSQEIWKGDMISGNPLKLSLETYASGIYFMEIENTDTGTIEQMEKIVIP